MNLLLYLRGGLAWLLKAIQSWMETGSRVARIEQEILSQQNEYLQRIEQLDSAIEAVSETMTERLARIDRRLDALNIDLSRELARREDAFNSRLDRWTQQITAQVNQVYASAMRIPAESPGR